MNGVDWHDNMLKLIASWVAKGKTDVEIHALAAQHTLDGYSADETRHEVQVMIDGARGKGFAPPEIAPPVEEPSDDGDDTATNTTTNAKTIVVAGETNPPLAYGLSLERRFVKPVTYRHRRPYYMATFLSYLHLPN